MWEFVLWKQLKSVCLGNSSNDFSKEIRKLCVMQAVSYPTLLHLCKIIIIIIIIAIYLPLLDFISPDRMF